MYKEKRKIDKKNLCCFFLVAIMLIFLAKSGEISLLIYDGVLFSVQKIIPSILPFLILTNLLIGTQAPTRLAKALSPVLLKLKLNPYILPPYILGIICGFPIGAIYTKNLYKKGMITKKEADILLPMCSYASPSFVISAVGSNMFGDSKVGLIIWLCSIAFCTAIGIILMPKSNKSNAFLSKIDKDDKYNFSASFLESVKSSTSTITYIGILVSFFYMLCGISKQALTTLGINVYAQAVICSLLEMGNGCYTSSQIAGIGIVLSSFSIGFCGLCVFFQVKSASHESSDMIPYIFIKLTCGLMTALFSYFIL